MKNNDSSPHNPSVPESENSDFVDQNFVPPPPGHMPGRLSEDVLADALQTPAPLDNSEAHLDSNHQSMLVDNEDQQAQASSVPKNDVTSFRSHTKAQTPTDSQNTHRSEKPHKHRKITADDISAETVIATELTAEEAEILESEKLEAEASFAVQKIEAEIEAEGKTSEDLPATPISDSSKTPHSAAKEIPEFSGPIAPQPVDSEPSRKLKGQEPEVQSVALAENKTKTPDSTKVPHKAESPPSDLPKNATVSSSSDRRVPDSDTQENKNATPSSSSDESSHVSQSSSASNIPLRKTQQTTHKKNTKRPLIIALVILLVLIGAGAVWAGIHAYQNSVGPATKVEEYVKALNDGDGSKALDAGTIVRNDTTLNNQGNVHSTEWMNNDFYKNTKNRPGDIEVLDTQIDGDTATVNARLTQTIQTNKEGQKTEKSKTQNVRYDLLRKNGDWKVQIKPEKVVVTSYIGDEIRVNNSSVKLPTKLTPELIKENTISTRNAKSSKKANESSSSPQMSKNSAQSGNIHKSSVKTMPQPPAQLVASTKSPSASPRTTDDSRATKPVGDYMGTYLVFPGYYGVEQIIPQGAKKYIDDRPNTGFNVVTHNNSTARVYNPTAEQTPELNAEVKNLITAQYKHCLDDTTRNPKDCPNKATLPDDQEIRKMKWVISDFGGLKVTKVPGGWDYSVKKLEFKWTAEVRGKDSNNEKDWQPKSGTNSIKTQGSVEFSNGKLQIVKKK